MLLTLTEVALSSQRNYPIYAVSTQGSAPPYRSHTCSTSLVCRPLTLITRTVQYMHSRPLHLLNLAHTQKRSLIRPAHYVIRECILSCFRRRPGSPNHVCSLVRVCMTRRTNNFFCSTYIHV